MSEDRRARNARNAAVGLTLTGAGETLGHVIGQNAGRAGKVAGRVLPRGLSAVGVPLAATGVVGAVRHKGQPKEVGVRHISGQVARQTVQVPGRGKRPTTVGAKDAGASLLAGGLGGLVARQGAHSARGRVVAGTIGSVATGSSMLYGRQRGRDAARRKKHWDAVAARSVAKGDKKQKTFRMPVPTALDTRDDWKTYKQRKRTADSAIVATGVGAGALAARTPHLVRTKKPGPKLVKLRSHGNKASEVLGAAAGITGVYSAVTGYRTNQHDLSVQRRRLRERDALLGRRSPVTKSWESEVAARATRGLRHGEWVGAHDPKRTKAALRGTKSTLWARGKYGTHQDDYSITERDGNFFLKPKRTIARQTDDAVYFRSYGGGMTGRGKVAIGAGAVGAGAAAAAGRRRSPVTKDAFTRKYSQHISTSAEDGYNYLRRGRNRQIGNAALGTGLAAWSAQGAIASRRMGHNKFAIVNAGLGALGAASAYKNAKGAKRWNGHMKKIKAKAYERAAAGEYGRDRQVAKEDLAKALLRTRPPGLPFPKGLRRAPTLRAGSVRRAGNGKMVAFRGSYG